MPLASDHRFFPALKTGLACLASLTVSLVLATKAGAGPLKSLEAVTFWTQQDVVFVPVYEIIPRASDFSTHHEWVDNETLVVIKRS